jgi:hypothetical protein
VSLNNFGCQHNSHFKNIYFNVEGRGGRRGIKLQYMYLRFLFIYLFIYFYFFWFIWLPLVTYEPVEFEEYPVEVQDFKNITDHLRGIYRIYLQFIKEKLKDHHM